MKEAFFFVQTFDAPKEAVFRAFSTAEALNAWWGPAETENSVVRLDFRPGGTFHFKMVAGGTVSYGRFHYLRIEPNELLEFTNAFADEEGNVVPAPFPMPFPEEIHYRITFREEKGKTVVSLTGRPVNATPEQEESFRSIHDSMQEGFGGTFDKLVSYLENRRS